MLKLYDDPISGNGYRVRLLLAQLEIPFTYVPVDILAGETRTPEFLARNLNGRIPLLELDGGSHLGVPPFWRTQACGTQAWRGESGGSAWPGPPRGLGPAKLGAGHKAVVRGLMRSRWTRGITRSQRLEP